MKKLKKLLLEKTKTFTSETSIHSIDIDEQKKQSKFSQNIRQVNTTHQDIKLRYQEQNWKKF